MKDRRKSQEEGEGKEKPSHPGGRVKEEKVGWGFSKIRSTFLRWFCASGPYEEGESKQSMFVSDKPEGDAADVT